MTGEDSKNRSLQCYVENVFSSISIRLWQRDTPVASRAHLRHRLRSDWDPAYVVVHNRYRQVYRQSFLENIMQRDA